MKFKAAILDKIDSLLIIGDIELPKLEVGQVLVKIHYSGICGAQLAEISGAAKGKDNFLPHLLGHEGSGVIVDKGRCFNDLSEGDRVVIHWRKGRGVDADFPVYKWGNKTVGGGRVTTFSEYAIISENRLTKIETNVALEKAALMGCSVTTALGLINNEARLKIGQSIMVIGCGGVGLNIIQGAKMVSANPIMAIDIIREKLEQAVKMGATKTAYSFTTMPSLMFDVVVDTTGIPELIEKGWCAAKEKLILVGQPHHRESFNFQSASDHFYRGKVMLDSQGGMTNPNVDILRYLELYSKNKLQINDPTLYPLEKVNDAVRDMEQGVVGKIMLEMNV